MTVFLLAFSVAVTILGLIPYLRLTAKGVVKPRLVTWGVWFVLAGVMAISALIDGHIASAVLSLQGLFGCLLVVVFGWRSGSKDVSRLDIFCLVGAMIGIVALVLLKSPSVALLLSITVDGIAFVPTLYHAWKEPFEEGLVCYIGNFGASSLVFSVAVIDAAGFMGTIYPIYSITFNLAMVGLILFGRSGLLEPRIEYQTTAIASEYISE